ncbi:meiosis-specific with OB domain-containing protein [Megalops cyprinoides]|uniref:meiosis-specific with OB domain-containing protein n=1 Tax=Megalops cyprinoides TaxID=118141 RepID=UPI001864E429|nr:meiosis-specific with OB domain-containing protein [Megalops cyprinoides]
MTYHAPVQNFVAICDLHPNSTHQCVLGVIIGKTDIKGFPDKKNIGSERFTFSFTIKDSPDHFINVSSWGSEDYIHGLSSSFRTGDCVIIENPLVVTKDVEKEDRFSPSTPSFYRLLVTETHSAVRVCSEMEADTKLLALCHLPVKDPRDFYSLGDIVANGQSLNGSVINILAVFRSVGEPKYFTTADGRKGQRCEVKLFDETIAMFSLICWDREAIQLVQAWIPRETVLFIADARVSFDNFRRSMVATVTSKTIITVNPDTKEANLLFNYARELSEAGGLDDEENQTGDVPLDSIADVFTVNQLKLKAQENLDSEDPVYGITFGFITTLNLDSSVSKVIRSRCAKCRFQVNGEVQMCTNAACPSEGQHLETTSGFDLLVDITDHTGTLRSCTLSSTAAEKTLGCTAEDFVCLTEGQRTALKWRFLLERCKIYLKVLASSKTRHCLRGNILSCTLADPVEVRQNVMI